jgi:hypothetical protein
MPHVATSMCFSHNPGEITSQKMRNNLKFLTHDGGTPQIFSDFYGFLRIFPDTKSELPSKKIPNTTHIAVHQCHVKSRNEHRGQGSQGSRHHKFSTDIQLQFESFHHQVPDSVVDPSETTRHHSYRYINLVVGTVSQ